jgi:hypothetical protein
MPLTAAEAREIIKQARGSRDKATQLAKRSADAQYQHKEAQRNARASFAV